MVKLAERSQRRSLLGLAAAILVVSSSSIWGESWREMSKGLPGTVAGASGLAIDPATPSTLYSWGGGGALFKSTDAALSWKTIGNVTGVYWSWLVIDPKNSSTIYAVSSRGLGKSADGGASWAFVNIAPGMDLVGPLVINPQDSNMLYAVTSGGIVKSTDGGANWSTLPGSQGLLAQFLTVDPMTPSTLYAVAVPGRGIFKSIDGGESWVAIKAGGLEAPGQNIGQGAGFVEVVHALVVDPVSPSTIYAAALDTGPKSDEGIIYKSSDGGQNWRAVRAGIPAGATVSSLAIDPGSPSSIYATYRSDGGWGVIKSTDLGESWTVMNAGFPSGRFQASPVVIDPANPSTIYVGYGDPDRPQTGGVFKSTNGAASWSAAIDGRSFFDISALAIDPVNAEMLYTAVSTEGLFKSVDAGANWTKLAALQFSQFGLGLSGRAYVQSLVIDFANPRILYAKATRAGGGCIWTDNLLFKSTDGGVTWIDSASPPFSGCSLFGNYGASPMVMDPTDPNTLYLEANLFDGNALGLYKSTDGGATWNDPGADCCIGNALVIDPSNPGTLYNGTPFGVFKSADGGATWSRVLNRSVNVLALDPANPSILYVATHDSGSTAFAGLFKSTDSGASWLATNNGLASLLDTGAPLNSLVIDPRNSSVLYAGTSGYGVFRSRDGGAHWSPFNDGLPNLDVRLLVLASKESILYAGTGSGIFAIRPAPETDSSVRRGR